MILQHLVRESLSEEEITEPKAEKKKKKVSPVDSWRDGTALQADGRTRAVPPEEAKNLEC